MGFLDQVSTDFEGIAAGEFSQAATVTDENDVSIEIRCLFDAPSTTFDPDTMSRVNRPQFSITLAETAYPSFDFRREDLAVTVGGQEFVTLGDWEYDGVGQLTIYLQRA